jgi:hypothetical protein
MKSHKSIFIAIILFSAPVVATPKSLLIKDTEGKFDIPRICKIATKKNFQLEGYHDPGALNEQPTMYTMSMSDTKRDRKYGIKLALKQSSEFIERYLEMKDPNIQKALQEVAENGPHFSDNALKIYERNFKGIRANPDPQMAIASKFGKFSCGFFGAEDCKKAAQDLIDIMAPGMWTCRLNRIPIFLSLVDEWESAGKDRIIIQGASRLALNILSKVSRADDQQKVEGDLLTDVQQVFSSLGLTQQKVNEYSIRLLGLYGTRGASMENLISVSTEANFGLFTALAVIANSVSYLDLMASEKGHVYSLPQNVNTTCDYTRPYHFWLSAYLAQRLNQKGHSARASFEAVHNIGVTYEMKADVRTNHPSLPLEDTYQAFVIETQKDIIFNGAGALWYLKNHLDQPLTLDLDQSFNTVFSASEKNYDETSRQGAETLGPLIKTVLGDDSIDFQRILKWRSTVAPDAHIEPWKLLLSN